MKKNKIKLNKVLHNRQNKTCK